MDNPIYEQAQARKVKARLRMLQHAQRLSGNVGQTCRFFGISRSLYYIWKKRFEQKGLAGLHDLKRRPHHIRYRIPPEIVSLVLRIREERRYGAVRRSLHLQRHYHAYVYRRPFTSSFTAIMWGRFPREGTVLARNRMTPRSKSPVVPHFPFAIQKIQTDNDSSFGPQFTWHLSDLSISHRRILQDVRK